MHFVEHNTVEDFVIVVAIDIILSLFKELRVLYFLEDFLFPLCFINGARTCIGVMPRSLQVVEIKSTLDLILFEISLYHVPAGQSVDVGILVRDFIHVDVIDQILFVELDSNYDGILKVNLLLGLLSSLLCEVVFFYTVLHQLLDLLRTWQVVKARSRNMHCSSSLFKIIFIIELVRNIWRNKRARWHYCSPLFLLDLVRITFLAIKDVCHGY